MATAVTATTTAIKVEHLEMVRKGISGGAIETAQVGISLKALFTQKGEQDAVTIGVAGPVLIGGRILKQE
jgi:hypothetical protein